MQAAMPPTRPVRRRGRQGAPLVGTLPRSNIGTPAEFKPALSLQELQEGRRCTSRRANFRGPRHRVAQVQQKGMPRYLAGGAPTRMTPSSCASQPLMPNTGGCRGQCRLTPSYCLTQ